METNICKKLPKAIILSGCNASRKNASSDKSINGTKLSLIKVEEKFHSI